MNEQALEYVKSHEDAFKQQLKDVLSIPSVSTLTEHEADCERVAEWLAADMRRIGFDSVEVIHTKWHPVVFAEWMGAGKDAPTVLVYGHYDVQPAEMSDGWRTP